MKIRPRIAQSNVFPQANDIYRIFNLGQELMNEYYTQDTITNALGLANARQVHYYFSATEYLGLTGENKKLTEIGMLIFAQEKNTILELLCYLILSVDIFADYYLNRDEDKIIRRLDQEYTINKSTLPRRFSTLKKWIEWCDLIVSDFSLNIIFI